MAHYLYDNYSHEAQSGNVNADTDPMKVYLVDSGYTPNKATHNTIADVPGGARLAEVTLTGVTLTGRTIDANDATFPTVPAGDTGTALVYTIGATEILYKYNDEASGLPIATNGLDINVTIDASGIAQLGTT